MSLILLDEANKHLVLDAASVCQSSSYRFLQLIQRFWLTLNLRLWWYDNIINISVKKLRF